ncbi:hypothetical protein TcWFU_001861 [Taenia crassiceps]|uniref:Uncharacterized protein n=1 Tax=Taenia crassiceps TaxID=6207 RepID=A0ABR4QP00_9CEST
MQLKLWQIFQKTLLLVFGSVSHCGEFGLLRTGWMGGMQVDDSSITDPSVNHGISLSASTTAQPSDMHHLVAASVSTPTSSECHISNPPSLDKGHVNMHMPVHSENRASVRAMKTFGSGVGASNLILDGPSLNHRCSGSDAQKDLEVKYEARLNSLAKIPTSRLANSSRIFSQSAGSLPVTPSAAAIIAAPPNLDCTGSLFFTSSDSTDENAGHCLGNVRSGVVQPLAPNPHLVAVVGGETALAEVDESSAAVAELTSEEATVSVGQSEAFEEDIDESIQISTS